MVKERFPEKTNFIPHALTDEFFKPMPSTIAKDFKLKLIGKERADHFVGLWINRNAKRKRANDVIESWKIFLDLLEKKHGHRKATLIMHTDPVDNQGSNLLRTSEFLNVSENVIFSKDRLAFEQIAIMHNVADFCLNISLNEGFGLGTLEAMQCGKPIVAIKTGGLTRQVVDHRDGSENGVALPVELKSLVGSQMVPYIYEDYVSNETTAEGIMKLYDMGPDGRAQLGEKARAYVESEFVLSKTISDWDRTLSDTISKWKSDKSQIYQPWECKTL